jgi:protein-L-isoaspartate O-methyltransferase
MRTLLEQSGYVKNESVNIWQRPGYDGIRYSDGDTVENKIAEIISNATDLTVLSTELASHCNDWPTRYHLSAQRANILRPFIGFLSGNVLEIGAGCGAITRFLGECGGKVLALEGTLRRASIAASRVRNLANVAVLSERFDRFETDARFDVITLIGVLEYASIFSDAEFPQVDMLERICKLLSPGGRLIIAIENQLGLKYFAGAPEDHLSQAMYGIEGRYRRGEPQTFGKQELSSLLAASGLKHSEFFSPCPDYKLPASIITPAGLQVEQGFDASALAVINVTRDFQLTDTTSFSLESAWPTVMKNGLGADLANSFLVLAARDKASPFDSTILAYHYSTQRRPEFCKESRFEVTSEGDVVVRTSQLVSTGKLSHQDNALKLAWSSSGEKTYQCGHLLAREFIEIVTRPGWRIEEVASFFRRYIDVLKELLAQQGRANDLPIATALLPGCYLDAIPSNIIITPGNAAALIDEEWIAIDGVEFGYLLFRSITSLIGLVSRFAPPASSELVTRGHLIDGVFNRLGLQLGGADFSRYLQLDSELNLFSTGLVNRIFTTWSPELALPGLVTADCLKTTLQRLTRTEQAKDRAERLAIERLEQARQLNEQLAATDAALSETQALALARLVQGEQLHQRLTETDAALSTAQSMAVARLVQVEQLHQRLTETDVALANAQDLAGASLTRVEQLDQRLIETDAALSQAQELAIARLEQLERLKGRLGDANAREENLKAILQAMQSTWIWRCALRLRIIRKPRAGAHHEI